MTRKVASELGHEVVEAADGDEGLAVLASRRVDLVLLDVNMPEMNGPEMLEALRATGDRTPVVLITSVCQLTTVARAVRFGIVDYVLKPFGPDTLRDMLTRLLGTPGPAIDHAEPSRPAPAAPTAPLAAAPRPRAPADVLVVDCLDHVHRKLRQATWPEAIIHGVGGADDALAHALEHHYRAILVDVGAHGDCATLMSELRALQPDAFFVALVLGNAAPRRDAMRAAGFDECLNKLLTGEALATVRARLAPRCAPS